MTYTQSFISAKRQEAKENATIVDLEVGGNQRIIYIYDRNLQITYHFKAEELMRVVLAHWEIVKPLEMLK